MAIPTISLIFGATAALVNIWLGMRCGRIRAAAKISHGDGGHPLLGRRMRAQLNFGENTPIALILTLALELAGFNVMYLWLIALFFIIARVMHALGMDNEGPNILRAAGMGVTMLCTLALIGCALKTAYDASENNAAPATVGGHA